MDLERIVLPALKLVAVTLAQAKALAQRQRSAARGTASIRRPVFDTSRKSLLSPMARDVAV
jgi:hypothetical protein